MISTSIFQNIFIIKIKNYYLIYSYLSKIHVTRLNWNLCLDFSLSNVQSFWIFIFFFSLSIYFSIIVILSILLQKLSIFILKMHSENPHWFYLMGGTRLFDLYFSMLELFFSKVLIDHGSQQQWNWLLIEKPVSLFAIEKNWKRHLHLKIKKK